MGHVARQQQHTSCADHACDIVDNIPDCPMLCCCGPCRSPCHCPGYHMLRPWPSMAVINQTSGGWGSAAGGRLAFAVASAGTIRRTLPAFKACQVCDRRLGLPPKQGALVDTWAQRSRHCALTACTCMPTSHTGAVLLPKIWSLLYCCQRHGGCCTVAEHVVAAVPFTAGTAWTLLTCHQLWRGVGSVCLMLRCRLVVL
jgi:hypothetical protein